VGCIDIAAGSKHLSIGRAVTNRLIDTFSEEGDTPLEVVFRNEQNCGFVLQDSKLRRIVEFVCGVEETVL